jgi:hypothetical protein
LSFERVKANRGELGALLESFVFSEILKLMTEFRSAADAASLPGQADARSGHRA